MQSSIRRSEAATQAACLFFLFVLVAAWIHPIPSRTRSLSTPAPMIVGGQPPAKVGQCEELFFNNQAPAGQFNCQPALCAGVAQLVEHYLAKVDVASSNLVSRSTTDSRNNPASTAGFSCIRLLACQASLCPSAPRSYNQDERGSSSAGRALPCQGRCREFESRLPLHNELPGSVTDPGSFCLTLSAAAAAQPLPQLAAPPTAGVLVLLISPSRSR